MKIKLYTRGGCANCAKVKALLQKLLPDYGLSYSKTVSELDIDDGNILAELLMMNAVSVPVLALGDSSLLGPAILDEGELRRLVTANLAALKGETV